MAEVDNLILSFCDTEQQPLVTGDGRLYAVIFAPYRDNRAVNFSDTPYELEIFNAGNQQDFATPFFQEGSQRTKYYSVSINQDNLNLPERMMDGEYYESEIWFSPTLTGTPNRSSDTLLKVERLYIINNRPINFPIDTADMALQVEEYFSNEVEAASATFEEILVDINEQVQKIPESPAERRAECLCSFVYDTEIQRIGVCAWLEFDGELVVDAASATISIIDSDGNSVAGDTITEPDESGCFFAGFFPIELSPDDNYFAVISITDSEAKVYTSGSSPVTWD